MAGSLSILWRSKKIYYVQAYEPEYYIGTKTIKGYLIAIISALSYHLPLKRIVNSPIYIRYKNLRANEFVPPGIDLKNFKPVEINKKLKVSLQLLSAVLDDVNQKKEPFLFYVPSRNFIKGIRDFY